MINRVKKLSPHIVVFLLTFFLVILSSRIYSAIRQGILDSSSPALKAVNSPLKEFKNLLFFHSIAKENSRLRNEADGLKRRLINQEEIQEENKRLKGLLSFKNKSPFSLIAASVIARDPSSWSSVIIIDKGKKLGIRENLAVITELGLAGKAMEPGINTSKVMLISDQDFSVAAILQRSREQGIVTGTINGICRMKYLSLESDVKVGDLVVTSGLSQEFPKGILIGTVIEEEIDSSGLFRNVFIKPAVNLSKLEEILIIIP